MFVIMEGRRICEELRRRDCLGVLPLIDAVFWSAGVFLFADHSLLLSVPRSGGHSCAGGVTGLRSNPKRVTCNHSEY